MIDDHTDSVAATSVVRKGVAPRLGFVAILCRTSGTFSPLFVRRGATDAAPLSFIARRRAVLAAGTLFAGSPAFDRSVFSDPPFQRSYAMSLGNLKDLFLHEVKDIYDGEKQITKALPKMIKAVSSDELRSALEEHLGVTEKHTERLEQIFSQLGKPVRGKKCVGMEGLLKEGNDFLKEDAEAAVQDAGIIGAVQKVEHYEIAVYGTLATYAKLLGLDEAATLLEDTLAEEKEADETLSELASTINVEAEQKEGEKEEQEMAVPRKRI